MKNKVSGKWFILPVVLLLVGIIGVVLAFFTFKNALAVPKQYFYGNEQEMLLVENDGAYAIYLEYTSYPGFSSSHVVFTFTNEDTGEVYTSTPATTSSNYNINGTQGVLISKITLPQGHYTVSASSPVPGNAAYAFTEDSLLASILTFTLVLIAGIFALVAGGIAFFIILILRLILGKAQPKNNTINHTPY